MLYIIPAWIASLVAVYLLGYYMRGLQKKIVELEKIVGLKVDKQEAEPEPESMVIDPTDEVQTAIYEHNKMMARLNNKDYSE